MTDPDDLEFRRLVRCRTELIDLIMAVCDSATAFAMELYPMAPGR